MLLSMVLWSMIFLTPIIDVTSLVDSSEVVYGHIIQKIALNLDSFIMCEFKVVDSRHPCPRRILKWLPSELSNISTPYI